MSLAPPPPAAADVDRSYDGRIEFDLRELEGWPTNDPNNTFAILTATWPISTLNGRQRLVNYDANNIENKNHIRSILRQNVAQCNLIEHQNIMRSILHITLGRVDDPDWKLYMQTRKFENVPLDYDDDD